MFFSQEVDMAQTIYIFEKNEYALSSLGPSS